MIFATKKAKIVKDIFDNKAPIANTLAFTGLVLQFLQEKKQKYVPATGLTLATAASAL